MSNIKHQTLKTPGPFTKGFVQVYTGNGKGKTTAAIGLAVRAAGADLWVLIAQFMKRGNYSEIKALPNSATKLISFNLATASI